MGGRVLGANLALLSSLLHIAFLLKILIFREGSCRLSTYTHKIFSDVIKAIFLTLPLGTCHKLAGTSFSGLPSPCLPFLFGTPTPGLLMSKWHPCHPQASPGFPAFWSPNRPPPPGTAARSALLGRLSRILSEKVLGLWTELGPNIYLVLIPD